MCESDRLLLKEIARNLSGKAKILQKSDVWMSESCTDLVRIITNYLGGPQPVMEADAEKVPKCCADMKPDPLGYDCVCPICGRTA